MPGYWSTNHLGPAVPAAGEFEGLEIDQPAALDARVLRFDPQVIIVKILMAKNGGQYLGRSRA